MTQMVADEMNERSKRDPETYAIIGAAMAVHRELGPGFLEPVYQEALAIEFDLRAIPSERERPLPILYKGQLLTCSYRADFVCFESIIVELKALAELIDAHKGQAINYLKATNFQRALLINFGSTQLEYERIVRNYQPQPQK